MMKSRTNPSHRQEEPTRGLEAALPRFLRRCDAESTRTAYERELLRFLAWLDTEPAAEVLLDYRDHLRKRGLGPTTIRWRTTVARAFLLFAEKHEYIGLGAVGDFKPPRGQSGFVPRVLNKAELKRLLNAPDKRSRRGRRDAVVLACLGVGGLRAGEVSRLNSDDLHVGEGRITLRVDGKGRKQRLVRLPAQYDALFRNYRASWSETTGNSAPLFWCGQLGHENKRITVAAVDYVVRENANAAGLSKLSAHTLRHTAASLAIEAGEPLHRLRDRLGHSSILLTSRYLHVRGRCW